MAEPLPSSEDIEHHLLVGFVDGQAGGESLGLQVEHGAVATAVSHQLVVGAELDDLAVLEHADAVGMPHGGEAVGDEDGGALPGATLSRKDNSKRMKSWNTAVTRDRHASTSNWRRSVPSTSMAPDWGS